MPPVANELLYTAVFSNSAKRALQELKRRDRKKLEKVQDLIVEILNSPRIGRGKPERLRHWADRDVWSRRINQKDRIVYEIRDNVLIIEVITIGGHYGDK